MHVKEVLNLPSILVFLKVIGYKIYFWSNENNEPIHVHISKGKLTQNSTKVWLAKAGGCILGYRCCLF